MSHSTNSPRTYSIGELAAEFGVTSRALRLYEEEGLLDPLREGTRRIYRERDRVRLRLILRGKRLGWSLAEIRESFDLYDSDQGEEAQLELMLDKLAGRRELLLGQKRDVEHALEEVERLAANAEAALGEIRSGRRKLRHA
jgi:DNA-binding transcriptional MerR regulator